MKSKLPENVFEAQLLEMAGAMGDKEDLLDSDDSEYDANFIDDEEDGDGNFQHPQKPGRYFYESKFVENKIADPEHFYSNQTFKTFF